MKPWIYLQKNVPIYSRKPIAEKYHAILYIIQGHLHSIEVESIFVQNMAGHEKYFVQKFNQYKYFSELNTLQGHLHNIKIDYILVESIELLAKKRCLYSQGNP